MNEVVGKIILENDDEQESVLLVKVNDEKIINYVLSSSINRIEYSIAELHIKKALPLLMLDYVSEYHNNTSDMMYDVKKALETGTQVVTSVTTYN